MLSSLLSQMLAGNLAVQTIGSRRDPKITAFFYTRVRHTNKLLHMEEEGACEWRWRICPLFLTSSSLKKKKKTKHIFSPLLYSEATSFYCSLHTENEKNSAEKLHCNYAYTQLILGNFKVFETWLQLHMWKCFLI